MSKRKGSDFWLEVRVPNGSDVWHRLSSARSDVGILSQESVDTSNKSEPKWRKLSPCGIRSASISSEGLVSHPNLALSYLQSAHALGHHVYARLISDASFFYIEGWYEIVGFERNGEYSGAEYYSVSLESTGLVANGDLLGPGEHWKVSTTSGINDCTWNEVAYSPSLGMFMVVARSGTNRVRYSYNGLDWHVSPTPPPDDTAWHTVVWTGAAWVIGGGNSTDRSRQCRISIDGKNWMVPNVPNHFNMDWQTMACTEGTGRILCHRWWSEVQIHRSDDHGSSWTNTQPINKAAGRQINRVGNYWAYSPLETGYNRILRTANLDGTSFAYVRIWSGEVRMPWSMCYGGGYYFVSTLNHNNQGSVIGRATNIDINDRFTLRPELPETFRRTNYRRLIYCPYSDRLLAVGDNYVDAYHQQGMILDTGLQAPHGMNLPEGGWKWICAAPGPRYVAVADSGANRIVVSSGKA